jgi:long-chain fatty acid transport protein
MRNPARRYAIVVGVVLPGVSGTALASGFALLEQSASRLGSAFAGTAAIADDATTIFYNPAGMQRLEQAEALIVLSGVDISSEFENRNSLPALGQPLGNDGGDAGGWNAIPAVYLAWPVNDRIALGLGINVPFGLKLEYGEGWIGRFQALKSEIETLNVNPALSFQLGERVTLGVGANY